MSDYSLPTQKEIQRFRKNLLGWYKEHGRDFPWRESTASAYEVIISELLLQRTQAGTVSDALGDLLKRYSSWESIRREPVEELENSLRPLGLWKRRASSLKSLANELSKRSDELPEDRDALEELPGIGQYMASAVRLVVFEHPEPLLDTNMSRVLERYFEPRTKADIRYDPYLQDLSRKVVDSANARALNFAILDLGALICRPRQPRCGSCPLRDGCRYASSLEDLPQDRSASNEGNIDG